jgi:hypothetical protein
VIGTGNPDGKFFDEKNFRLFRLGGWYLIGIGGEQARDKVGGGREDLGKKQPGPGQPRAAKKHNLWGENM